MVSLSKFNNIILLAWLIFKFYSGEAVDYANLMGHYYTLLESSLASGEHHKQMEALKFLVW